MPKKKKSESAEVPATEPKKSLASIRSFRKETDVLKPKPTVSRTKKKSAIESRTQKIDLTAVSIWAVTSVLLFSAIGAAIYFYRAYKVASEVKPEGSEIEQLISRIDRVMELPRGETPTLATVTDKEKLVDQEFFRPAENGDKVLIYQQSGRAILFRPSTGRIMNVSPVSTKDPTQGQESADTSAQPSDTASVTSDISASTTENPNQTQPVSVPAPAGKAKIALYNGSPIAGVTAKTEKQVVGTYAETMEVVTKDAASKKDYEGTLIVDLSGIRSQEASELAGLTGGTVSSSGLPEGERVPDGADILIIIGNVKK
ncbi:MAG: hypothetical protein HGA31_02220 [Candidatus Moranbacteria bacterium]|nr:hypothetical protein [Candidatus Moranbacteria bacterium]